MDQAVLNYFQSDGNLQKWADAAALSGGDMRLVAVQEGDTLNLRVGRVWQQWVPSFCFWPTTPIQHDYVRENQLSIQNFRQSLYANRLPAMDRLTANFDEATGNLGRREFRGAALRGCDVYAVLESVYYESQNK